MSASHKRPYASRRKRGRSQDEEVKNRALLFRMGIALGIAVLVLLGLLIGGFLDSGTSDAEHPLNWSARPAATALLIEQTT